jgi:NAD(P)-dependent dehydrogenase (short-subunit alcohol dehydrogenase family)
MSVTLITGAGGGMGLACVEKLRGEALFLTDIKRDALNRAAEIAPDAHSAVVDLGSPDGVAELAGHIEALGGLRHAIHLAGVSPMMDDVDRLLQVDLVATAELIDALENMAHPGSVAVCVASIAGHLITPTPELMAALDEPRAPQLLSRLESAHGGPLDTGLAYCFAKLGVMRLCERAAPVWGARGARIVSVSPGLIDTPMGRLELQDNSTKRLLLGLTPVRAPKDSGSSELPGRIGDIADAIMFLVSAQARFVNGCDLRVDGGLVAALRAAESAPSSAASP